MRLINVATLEVEDFPDDKSRPAYSILSHRWDTEEVTLQDMQSKKSVQKKGYAKIKKSCEVTAKEGGLEYCWIDTCCIDKTSSAELSEAINSMYIWYAEAVICYAFLNDVDVKGDPSFEQSKWFSRGWTLQELVAPQEMRFYDKKWEVIGQRNYLVPLIQKVTGLPLCLLAKEKTPQEYSVAQRFSWAAKRETTRKEDMAYCLMGLMDVNMPLLYGEGDEKAFRRLQEEIIKHLDDVSIFAWTSPTQFTYPRDVSSWGSVGRSLLAPSIACFSGCGSTRSSQQEDQDDDMDEFHVTNRGISITLHMSARTECTYVAMLDCSAVHLHGFAQARCNVGIFLHRLRGTRAQFIRVSIDREDIIYGCHNKLFLAGATDVGQKRILVPLRPRLLFREWSINVSQLRGKRSKWRPVPGTPVPPSSQKFANRTIHESLETDLDRVVYGHKELGRMVCVPDSVFSAVRIGLDTKQNPVLFFFAEAMYREAHQMDDRFPWDDDTIHRFTLDPEANWNRYGYFALQGHWENGIRAELHFLNLYVKLYGLGTWHVDFCTIQALN